MPLLRFQLASGEGRTARRQRTSNNCCATSTAIWNTSPHRTIETIFIGGGTPSLISGRTIAALLARHPRSSVDVADDAEITLEANPGAVDEANFAAYRAAGVNRLSIGAQSFDPSHLTALGRIHDPDDIERAVASRESRADSSASISI